MRNLKDTLETRKESFISAFSICVTIALINLATLLFFHGSSYHIETSSLICFANQWTGFYMLGTSVVKELRHCTMGWKNVDLNTLEKTRNGLEKRKHKFKVIIKRKAAIRLRCVVQFSTVIINFPSSPHISY